MSGVCRAIGRAFKSVTKAITGSSILKSALVVGAAYFTAGAAGLALPGATIGGSGVLSGIASAGAGLTGATATTGMFSTAAAAASSAMGPTVGSMVSGAISGAATGAMFGGGVSALTHGDIGRGMLTGGLMGAAAGGVQGYFNAAPPPGSVNPTEGSYAWSPASNTSPSQNMATSQNSTTFGSSGTSNALSDASQPSLYGSRVADSSLVTPLPQPQLPPAYQDWFPPNGLKTIGIGTLANTALNGYINNKILDKQIAANKANLDALRNSYSTKPIVI
ncbi:MAG: hypothetical protein HQL63_02435 [Magnetococcales bacterium]|nr:hypothetical protein [Magnetococcales bacterium]MBF0321392.1 hypothetical protein [Magnetococcales bacterium]